MALLMWLSFLLSLISLTEASSFDFPLYTLPEIQYPELLTLDPFSINQLVKQLTTIGAVQITNIPKYSESRKEALTSVGNCLKQQENSGKREMPDGSIRYSTGAPTIDGLRGPMSVPACGETASKLRSVIDSVTQQVFLALDIKMQQAKPVRENGKGMIMEPNYYSFNDLMSHGSHLEHLHAYFPPVVSSEGREEEKKNLIPTMDFHTDNGLMIAMTSGLFSFNPDEQAKLLSEVNGLYMVLPDERKVKVDVSDSSLILLMGQGASSWLKPVLGKPFRAVPHALIVDLPSSSQVSRSWFGKMFLPPPNALIPSYAVAKKIRYEDYHNKEIQSQKSSSSYLPLACGGGEEDIQNGMDGRQLLMLQNSQCYDDKFGYGVYCWMQCQQVNYLPCGYAAQCVMKGTVDVVPSGDCMPCELKCLNGTEPSSNGDYCIGNGISMSMTGFISIVSEEPGTTECFNILFPEWTLDSETKFAFACLGVLALGVFIQYLTLLRTQIKSLVSDPLLCRLTKILTFGIQVVLSYFLMLVAMTYSVELFCMVVIGLTIGYGLFHTSPNNVSHGISSGFGEKAEMEIHADPCCPEESPEDQGYDRLRDETQTAVR